MGFIQKLTNIINPSTVDNIKSTISKHGGLSRPNRFAIIFTPPGGSSLFNIDLPAQAISLLSGGFNWRSLINDPRDIALLCSSCSLPGKIMETVNLTTVRNEISSANGYRYEDVTAEFILTNDYFIKNLFDKWHHGCVDPVTYRVNYEEHYKVDVIIQQLNGNNLPVYGIKLVNAWPSSVNSVTLSNEEDNSYSKLSVTFNFEDVEPASGLKTGLLGIKNQIGGINRLV